MKFLYLPEYESDDYTNSRVLYELVNLKFQQYPIITIHPDSEIWLEEVSFPLTEGIYNTSKILGLGKTNITVNLSQHWLAAVRDGNDLTYFILIPSTHPKKWYSIYTNDIYGYTV